MCASKFYQSPLVYGRRKAHYFQVLSLNPYAKHKFYLSATILSVSNTVSSTDSVVMSVECKCFCQASVHVPFETVTFNNRA